MLNYFHRRSRSVEGGSLRAASHPPSQPPPQPPVPTANVSVSVPTASAPQIGWAELPPAPLKEQSTPVPTSPPLSSLPPSPDRERPTPVPAPRYFQTIEPAMNLNLLCPGSLSRHYPTNQRASPGTNIHLCFLRITFCISEMQAELGIPMDGGEVEGEGRARICEFSPSLDPPFLKSDPFSLTFLANPDFRGL